MKRFLIIQTAFIGDVILATPVISELKRIYPDSEIDVLVRKGNESLLANNSKIHQVFTLNKKDGKYKAMRMLIKQFRAINYDEVINLHRFASTGFITALSGAKSRVGFDKNPFSRLYSLRVKHEIGNGKHEVERNLSCIARHGSKTLVRPEIFPSEADTAVAATYQQSPYFCLSPASVWFTKQLPERKWIELAKRLAKKGQVYLTGGPGDFDLCERLKNETGSENCHNLAGKFSFLQSAALFSKAEMNYVNDSGPLHFCSAVNAPVTAFFCSTIPGFGFGPLSENAAIIETSEPLTCKPCGLHGYKSCPKKHFLCGESIKMDLVK
ncbi:MAG: heptosyltransferase [Crocinitomicaceae bacterium]|nr:heptosyltransferase [Crocinitomicaceae bacterium]